MVTSNRILAEFCSATGIAQSTSASASGSDSASASAQGTFDTLPSRLRTTELAIGAVASTAASAALLAETRGADPTSTPWVVDPRRVAASFRGDQLLRMDGEAFPSFAPLSGFFRTRDGWLRTHANYPHHRARLLAALGLPDSADRAALSARLLQLDSLAAESVIRDRQGIAAAVRTPESWAEHPQSAAVATLPLICVEELGPAARRTFASSVPDPLRPAAGVRVLDLTRVIAGPVATRTLALLGADVLRVDDPHLPELAQSHLDNGMGKRSTLLDLRKSADLGILDGLLQSADVVVTGYRPHALDAFGLDPRTLAQRRPGLVVATLDAWGPTGPWSGYRGFDSIVQAASGISILESPGDAHPGALPAQALDHASGYLLSGAVLVALSRQAREGGTWHVHAHLARTAQSLLRMSDHQATETTRAAGPGPAFDLADCLAEQQTPGGLLRYPLPALTTAERPLDYPSVGGAWGVDEPRWLG